MTEDKKKLLNSIINNPKKMFCFFIFVIISLSIVSLFSYFILPEILKKIISSTNATGIEVTTSGFKITTNSILNSQETTVINLPAFQFMQNTDVILENNSEIIINASGYVETGAFFNWDKILYEKFSLINPINQILNSRFNNNYKEGTKPSPYTNKIGLEFYKQTLFNDIKLTWRDPDGNFKFPFKKDLTILDEKSNNLSRKYKILEYINWGTLIGCYLTKEEELLNFNLEELRKRCFPIGKNATIIVKDNKLKIMYNSMEKFIENDICNDKQNEIINKNKNTNINFYNNSKLFLMINDCYLSKEIFSKLTDKENKGSLSYNDYLFEKMFYSEEFKTKFGVNENNEKEWDAFVNQLWFLNNNGQFIVLINKKKI